LYDKLPQGRSKSQGSVNSSLCRIHQCQIKNITNENLKEKKMSGETKLKVVWSAVGRHTKELKKTRKGERGGGNAIN
jgi:hypothetical protein